MAAQIPLPCTLSAGQFKLAAPGLSSLPLRDTSKNSFIIPSGTDISLVFEDNSKPLCLDVGFGLGDNLLKLAKENPHKNFIGIEIELAYIRLLNKKLRNLNLKNLKIIHSDDINVFMQQSGEALIDEVYYIMCNRSAAAAFKNSTHFTKLDTLLKPGGLVYISTSEPLEPKAVEIFDSAGYTIISRSEASFPYLSADYASMENYRSIYRKPKKQLRENLIWINQVKAVNGKPAADDEIQLLETIKNNLVTTRRVFFRGKEYIAKYSAYNDNRQTELRFITPQAGILHRLNARYPALNITKAKYFLNVQSGDRYYQMILFEVFPEEGIFLSDIEEPLDFYSAVNLMLGISRTLKAVHNEGVIHWDLSPDNIYVNGGRAVINDFDCAFSTQNEFFDRNLNQVYTNGFVSRKKAMLKIDPKCEIPDFSNDIYSLAKILLFITTKKIYYSQFLHSSDALKFPAAFLQLLHNALVDDICSYTDIDQFVNDLEKCIKMETFPLTVNHAHSTQCSL